jgi:uncharacterized membrane protein YoaK (UPF0700 family)
MKYEDTILAAIAGFVDRPDFVALFGLFTAYVTGNVTQAIQDAVDRLSTGTSASARMAARARFARTPPPVAAFAMGAMEGAISLRYAGFLALLAPACALVGLASTTGENDRAAPPGYA